MKEKDYHEKISQLHSECGCRFAAILFLITGVAYPLVLSVDASGFGLLGYIACWILSMFISAVVGKILGISNARFKISLLRKRCKGAGNYVC